MLAVMQQNEFIWTNYLLSRHLFARKVFSEW